MTSSSERYPDADYGRPSSGAVGLTVFAAAMLVVVGFFQALQGFVALVDDKFYINTVNYTFEFDTTAWGWIHLLLGAAFVLVGVGLMSGATWAHVTGIIIVILGMFDNFLFIPYYPFWAILIIGLDVAIIWALAHSMSRRPV